METDQGNWGQIWVVPLILLLSCLCCWQGTRLYINYVDEHEHRLVPENEERYMSQLLKRMENNHDVAYAFATALRLNHPAAYDLTAPELWPIVDGWMDEHQRRACMTPFIRTGGVPTGSNVHSVTISCTLTSDSRRGWHGDVSYVLRVSDIVIINQLVVSWGEAIESSD